MKIRTRLLLFLLPPLLGGIAVISILFAYNVMGLMATDVNAHLIDEKFQEGLLLIVLSSAFTIAMVVASLYFIANKISAPVQKLNNSALAIAAGQYGESIQVSGPKEIVELANTLNTMSECLHENINRLKENSLLRERMYGEYECATMLQHLMLQKNIDDCRSDAVAVKSISFFSKCPRGLLLDFPKPEKKEHFLIHMAEAEQEGFEGMYELLTQYKLSRDNPKYLSLTYDRTNSTLLCKGPELPLFWSLDNRRFIEPNGKTIPLESGDFFFLFNRGLINFYKERDKVGELLAKVLKLFASDGLETTAAMLQKELTFATKRKELSEDIHLLCFQVLIGQ